MSDLSKRRLTIFLGLLTTTILVFPSPVKSQQPSAEIELDSSYSLEPKVVRMTELLIFPEVKMLRVSEYYCSGHPQHESYRFYLLKPTGNRWIEGQPNDQLRGLACDTLAQGEFNLDSEDEYISLAYRLRERERFMEAEEVFRKAMKVYAPDSPLFHGLGNILKLQNKPQEAIDSYQQAIKLTSDPNLLSIIYNSLGNLFDDNNEIDKALTAYQKALTLNPRNDTVHYDLAVFFFKQKQIQEAIKECNLALEINPDNQLAKSLLDSLNAKP